MIREQKEQAVKRIEEWLSDSNVAIVTDYRGMTVSEMSQLRRQLRDSGTQYHVVKNNMAAIAADAAGREALKDLLTGPCAIAFGYGEISETARVLSEFIRTAKVPLQIKGGLLNKRLLYRDDVTALASLPSRDALLSQLAGQMQAPISALLSVLSANLTGLMRVLQARKQQLEGG
ncbi:50S ribosomal protein L10 [Chloroflexota bacterium]